MKAEQLESRPDSELVALREPDRQQVRVQGLDSMVGRVPVIRLLVFPK
jgi:hypothetical protein